MPGDYDSGVFDRCEGDSGDVSTPLLRCACMIQWLLIAHGCVRHIYLQAGARLDALGTPSAGDLHMYHILFRQQRCPPST